MIKVGVARIKGEVFQHRVTEGGAFLACHERHGGRERREDAALDLESCQVVAAVKRRGSRHFRATATAATDNSDRPTLTQTRTTR